MFHKFDLHTHSTASDGADHPAEVVRGAKAAGIELLALSDHDTVRGYAEAKAEADRQGIALLRAVEIGTEFSEELHILGLDIDIENMPLLAALDRMEVIINSMTKKEREKPEILNGSRRARIAKGAGTTVQEVNQVIKKFNETKKMVRKMTANMEQSRKGKKGKKGKKSRGLRIPGMGGMSMSEMRELQKMLEQ